MQGTGYSIQVQVNMVPADSLSPPVMAAISRPDSDYVRISNARLWTSSKTVSTACTDIDTLRPRQNGRHFPDIFKSSFFNERVLILNKISLKFVPKGPINNIPPLVQIKAWCHRDDKPLSEPMLVTLLIHICVTRPQWVNGCPCKKKIALLLRGELTANSLRSSGALLLRR